MTGSELLIPVIPAALALLLLALLSLDRLLLLTLFLTPLSLQLSYLTGASGIDLSLPTEPVMALLLLIALFKLFAGGEFPRELLRHPLTILICLYLLWTMVTALTSTMPGVSFKTLAYRAWFTAGFYLITARLAYEERFRQSYILAYALGLAVVVLYFIVRIAGEGMLNQQFAHSACYPFFNDHTSFGASIAFLLPPLTLFFFLRRGSLHRGMILLLILLLAAGFVLSYSRAAWVSLLAAIMVSLVLWMRIKPRLLITLSALCVIALPLSAGWLWNKMDSTTEDSSTDFGRHLRSSANITTDQSNLERINRWKSALRMFAEKPHTGWGPGTYQFMYAPFQKPADKTAISTSFGDAGNAHSEYLGALSESGWPGALLFTLITLAGVITGIRVWYRRGRSHAGWLALALVAGLATYAIHGVMNSFLDTDKIAALWWGFLALTVAIDLEERGGVMAAGRE